MESKTEQTCDNASKHIAVLAFPFGTHAAPLLNLVLQLSHACPDTVFSFLSTEKSNSSMFPMKLDKVKPFNVWDGLPEGYSFRDAFYAFGADLADDLNVPWVAFWTAGPRALFVHADTDFIRHHVGIDGPQDMPLDFLPDFSGIRVADLPSGITSGDFDAPVPALLHKMGQALPRATAIAANSYEDLDNTVVNMLKLRFNMYLNIGPFNLVSSSTVDDSHGCLDWLSKQEPASVVYISFGSVITPPPHELQALSEALEEIECPFLWSFRGDPEKQLPQGFLERTRPKGKIVPWAPQQKILEHSSVGAFVSHGGWNSVLESIVGGVPMVFRPFFGDQGLNTRTVEGVWGFGLGLEGGTLTKEGAMKALKLTLCSEQGKKMRDRIGQQKELAYNAVKPNGGSSVENFKTLLKVVSNKLTLKHKGN
ncbi:hypothetical protein V6N13_000484 [Hibiscus sabdariffa]|uniref:Glycosyltransferase n=1 Tax=Hibiscus sabdariffa TaxID=183260 RepID=A0ABR2G5E4_9ROSI